MLDAALAIAESFLYPGIHLKYLHVEGMGRRSNTPIPAEMPRYFKFFRAVRRPGAGETLVHGLGTGLDGGCLRAVPEFVTRHQQGDPAREEMTVPVASGPLKLVLSWVGEEG